MEIQTEKPTPARKALLINLDPTVYGTFAEIGAGQEVARYFFQVGGAAGTIAKTMSAYDMKFSDEIYGHSQRYVSRERLLSMLDHEYGLLQERLSKTRGVSTRFFAFANTVAARGYKKSSDYHGWVGIRYQLKPGEPSNDLIVHVRMLDSDNLRQQQALGMVGVNLVYAVFYMHNDLDMLVDSLTDGLTSDRIEIDMIHVQGPAFQSVDSRLVGLKLIRHGLTNAVMFSPEGKVLHASEVLHKKLLLVERGTFRPVTWINVDMLKCTYRALVAQGCKREEMLALFEITINSAVTPNSQVIDADILSRIETLAAFGFPVLVTDYGPYYQLVSYLRRHTSENISLVVGMNNIVRIFDESFYSDLPGGLVQALGTLFQTGISVFAYPMYSEVFERYMGAKVAAKYGTEFSKLVGLEDLPLKPDAQLLLRYFLARGALSEITDYNKDYLTIATHEIGALVERDDPVWERLVPPEAVTVIRNKGLFGLGKQNGKQAIDP